MRKIKKHLKKIMLLLLVFMLATSGFAQKTIKGIVTDSSGAIIQGVSVSVKGSNKGTTTNSLGEFTINAAPGTTLTISYVGFASQTVLVGNDDVIRVQLVSSIATSEAVVVTALGIKKEKKKLGYATQEIKGSAMEKAREPNIINALSGRVAGVTVTNTTTLFENSGLYLRGNPTMIVIDGIPSRGDLWNLNPDDIESINVLKSNAAALLYGSMGKNGALQITTKKGKGGANGVEVSVNQSLQFQGGFLKFPETQTEYGMGSLGYYGFIDGKSGSAGGTIGSYSFDDYGYVYGPKLNQKDPTTASGWMEAPQYNSPYDPNQLYSYKEYGYVGYSHYKPIPWITRGANNLKNFLRNEMLSTTNVSVAGKSDKGEFRISMTHFFQKGQVPNTKINSSTLNLAGNIKITPKLKIEGSLSYNKQYSPNYPTTGYSPTNHFYNILLWMGPDVDIRDLRNYWKSGGGYTNSSGQFVPYGVKNTSQFTYNYTWYNNPYFLANEYLRSYSNDVIVAGGNLNYDITKELSFTLTGGATVQNIAGDLKTPYSFINYTDADKNGQYSMYKKTDQLFESKGYFTYKKKFLNDFEATVLLGAAYRYIDVASLDGNTIGGLQVPLTYNLANSREAAVTKNSLTQKEVKSVYNSTDISYKRMAYLNLSFRNDWTTALQKPNNSFFYPSASLGLIVSEMMKMPAFISFAKIRGAYADVSSDPSAYYTLATYSPGTRWNGTPSLSLPNRIIDDNIKPDKTISREGGVEMKFLKNRLGFDFTYYSYLDKNSIRDIDLSPASGFSVLRVNGDIYTRNGIELILNATPIKKKDFSWNTELNYTTYRRKVKEYYGGAQIRGTVKVGERTDVYAYPAFERAPDGQIVYEGGLPKIANNAEKMNLGFINEDWSFGLSNSFNYKNFTFSFLFDGRIGGLMRNGVEGKLYEGGMHKATANSYRDDAYEGKDTYVGQGVEVVSGSVTYDVQGNITSDTRKFAPNTKMVNYFTWLGTMYPSTTDDDTNGQYDSYMYNKTFVKLREVVVSYNLTGKVLRKTPFKSASISLVGRNVLLFTKVPFMDPDAYSGNDIAEPSYRNIGVNLNVKF